MTSPRPRPAFFMDRDGCLIVERTETIVRPAQVELVPGAAAAIRRLNDAYIPTIVATNQSAIARGKLTEPQLASVHGRIRELLHEEAGATLEAIYHCPHHPDHGPLCRCRKPAPGLLNEAIHYYHLYPPRSFMTGDMPRDIEAGRAAGLQTILVTGTGKGGRAAGIATLAAADFQVNSLPEAIDLALAWWHEFPEL